MALSLAEGVLGDLRDRNVLVVGAGRIALQTLKALSNRGVRRTAVANRTPARAQDAAAPFGSDVYSLAELPRALSSSDLVVTATCSETPVVTVADVRAASGSRRGSPLVIVDLAVPADVERDAAGIEGVSLFDVDDLRAGLDEAMATRLREVPKVEEILEEEAEAFGRRYRELEVEPTLAALRRRAEQIRAAEVERTLRLIGDVDDETAEHVRRLSHALVKKLLHEPTARLRERAGAGDAEEAAAAARDLFGIE
jgi:glutamyl-tRNA reductase